MNCWDGANALDDYNMTRESGCECYRKIEKTI